MNYEFRDFLYCGYSMWCKDLHVRTFLLLCLEHRVHPPMTEGQGNGGEGGDEGEEKAFSITVCFVGPWHYAK